MGLLGFIKNAVVGTVKITATPIMIVEDVIEQNDDFENTTENLTEGITDIVKSLDGE